MPEVKRNYEWDDPDNGWDGYFTQDKAGDATATRVSPDMVIARLKSEGFVPAYRNERAETSGTGIEIPANTLEVFGTLTGDTTFTLGTPVDPTIETAYHWIFVSGNTAYTVTWPSGILWVGGVAPTIASDTTYEVHICEGLAVIGEFA